jgi:hypothetical protein
MARFAERAQYYWPVAEGDLPLVYVGSQFLQLLDEECPKARKKLRSDVSPAYRRMFENLEARQGGAPIPRKEKSWRDASTSDDFHIWFVQAGPEFEDAKQPLRSALEEWVDEFNLRAIWVGDTVLRTIRAWESGLDYMGRYRYVLRAPTIPMGLS